VIKERVGVVCCILVLAGSAGAGELVLTNGSRLDGELANEILVVSTGTDLVEIQPEQVDLVTPDAVQLRGGRVIRGSLVGGHVRIRTPLGEIAVRPGELEIFRADGVVVAGPRAEVPPGSGPSGDRGQPSARDHTPVATVAVTTPDASRLETPGRRLEVVADEANLRRDALANADTVGRVARGDQVTYVDSIDRRLRILNILVFDGGHWIKVRAADGSVGWIPAQALREVR